MRKAFFLSFLLLLLAIVACAAADTEYFLSPCPGSVTIPDANYTVLTPENLDQYPDLLSVTGHSKEFLISDWEDRGVVLQAWFKNTKTHKYDACLEIVVRQDEDSRQYYDLANHSADAGWKTFISSHKGQSAYKENGYTFSDVAKKQQTGKNYFLRLKYKRAASDGKTAWGYIAKTVARGYTVVFDYQVIDRGIRSGDEGALSKVVNTVKFYDGGNETAGSSGTAYLQITDAPPKETNSDTFTVKGRTTPGARVIGVLMRINSADPVRFYAEANGKNGDFSMKVTLPEENVWLMTLNVEVNDQIVADQVFETTTYRKTLLPVSFEKPIPEVLGSDETVISGMTDKGVTVQCIVSNGKTTYEKQIRASTGRFNFKIPTSVEAAYHFTLVFSKKGFDTRRYTGDAVRNLSEEERVAAIKKSAVKPGYSELSKNLDKYINKVMVYNLYIVSIQQSGPEWIIEAALNKNNAGYKNMMYFLSEEEPDFEIGSQQLLYGTCIGPYVIQSAESGSESYPAFDLLFVGQ